MQALLPVTSIISQARQGVLRRRVDEVAHLVGLTDKEMARILNMSIRGLHGKATATRLSLAASERLLLLERLVQRGLAVFDGRADLLARWLRTPLAELAYRPETDLSLEGIAPGALRDMGSFKQPVESAAPPAIKATSPTLGTQEHSVVAQSPLAVLDTVSGFSLAEDVLGRLEWGLVG
ncbi:antitoxin Xre-like helix-turn-helix domain-containing protein [Larkinella insperata]|uniref:Antitoxin Xre-like helix-turn-helix domain-containing protein n=1 Tax=Larkinella insperata TaxID=332158 RepID=A0ABW3Q614_9BACT